MATSASDSRAAAPAGGAYPVFDLGIAPYLPVQDVQGRLRSAVADGFIPGVILLLEHTPVITLGNRRSPGDLRDSAPIRARGLEVAESERGGQATLHAPGQLVSYPIVPVPHRDLRAFVRGLEEILRLLLQEFGVSAHRREGRPGLYVDGRKIASVGLRCHRWVSSHGTSLNATVDLSLFDLIVACGEPELRQTSLQALTGETPPMSQVKAAYLRAAQTVFGWDLCAPKEISYAEVEAALRL
ncbi:MAG: lipoyl(octanoyl) transferase LipB [Thermoleophilia bacterium]|nr:lipoyl(octanoyl) transferase LipB [Thermoleophilia bacterium]